MRSITEFRLIIASPSDVYEERKAIFDAISELNLQLESQNYYVRALGWEEYVSPGIGDNPQAVINEQLFQSWDMLVAIFGAKLGSPSGAFRSGTLEEIEKAIASDNSVFKHHRIQIYFKDSISSISKIDPTEFSELLSFRSSLGSRGILYGVFSDAQQLSRAIRLNVQRAISNLTNNAALTDCAVVPSIARPAAILTGDEDEPGILDLLEKSESSIDEMTTEIDSLALIIESIAMETNKQTILVEKENQTNVSSRIKKQSINRFAAVLTEHAQQLFDGSSRAKILFNTLHEAQTELRSLLVSSATDAEIAQFQRIVTESFGKMLTGSVGARDEIINFRKTVESLPRITSEFQRAKRRLLEAIDENIGFLNNVESGILELMF